MSNEKKNVELMTKEDVIELAKECQHVSTMLSVATEHENRYKKKLSEMDARVQDLLHDAELSSFNRSEKVHLVNQLKEARIERRKAKDVIELLNPLGKIVKDISNLSWKLNEIYKKISEIQGIQNSRTYTSRVSSDLKIPTNVHVEVADTNNK